jgi:SpoVK/Ycf46/Vps4 family AAA+-type ATPase
VSTVLGISPLQSALFALVLEQSGEKSVSLNEIAETLKCGKIQMLKYMDEFDILEQKRLIRKSHRSHGHFWGSERGSLPSYIITLDVIKAIREGVEFRHADYENLTPEGFLDAAEDLLEEATEDHLDLNDLVTETKTLLDLNKELGFVKKQKEYDLGEGSILILFIFFCALLHDDEETLPLSCLRPIFGRTESRHIEQRFKSREHKLLKRGLIENGCDNGMADTQYFRLTEKAKNEFLAEMDIKEKSRHHGKDFISAETHSAKKLFYGEKVTRRIAELTGLLREENFKNIQKRLEENKMRTGFACLFSGPPGTGKTETVYQIARETGRDIMLVDISETKTMWFGESEKRIKAVFNRYRSTVKSGGRTPILLFNEADAVLGKRQELGASRNGPGQTENAIQNIILQEIENLSGILIATTNMTGNLDKAFERRFLYKIEFEKPDITAKKAIWQSIIPSLPDDDALTLSKKFDFSGGQIENIARRQMVRGILTGVTPALPDVIALCGEELLEKEAMKQIGFCVE